MKFFRAWAWAVFLAGCAPYCRRAPGSDAGQVTATGRGEIRVAPDLVQFSVEVVSNRATLPEAVDEAQRIAEQVLEACGRVIPDSNDVRITRVSANKRFDWENGANVFKGYEARQSVEVTLRDLSRMEELTRGILQADVGGIGGLSFNHSRADSLRGEAGALAARDAEKNARKICAALNRTCEELVSARTLGGPEPGPLFEPPPGVMEAKAAPLRGIALKPGWMTFSAQVEATYRLGHR